MNLTYLRLEVVRVLRNKRVLVFSILLPSILLLVIGSPEKHEAYQGTTVAAYIMVSASTTLLTTYFTGFSGVRRSWRFQPTPRSTAIDPAAPVADDIAPKIPMLTMM